MKFFHEEPPAPAKFLAQKEISHGTNFLLPPPPFSCISCSLVPATVAVGTVLIGGLI